MYHTNKWYNSKKELDELNHLVIICYILMI